MKRVVVAIVLLATLYVGFLGGFAAGTSVARRAFEKQQQQQQQPLIPGRFTITRYDDGKVVVFDSATGQFDTYLPQPQPPASTPQPDNVAPELPQTKTL